MVAFIPPLLKLLLDPEVGHLPEAAEFTIPGAPARKRERQRLPLAFLVAKCRICADVTLVSGDRGAGWWENRWRRRALRLGW